MEFCAKAGNLLLEADKPILCKTRLGLDSQKKIQLSTHSCGDLELEERRILNAKIPRLFEVVWTYILMLVIWDLQIRALNVNFTRVFSMSNKNSRLLSKH
jgi:hypothetical protein